MDSQEEKLISSLKIGDEFAYRILFDRYYALMISHSMKYQADLDVAREIVQSIFISLFEKRETLKIQFSLKAYLLKSVYYQSINHTKKLKYFDEIEEESSIIDEDLLVSAENEARIWNTIHQLTPQQQKILKLSRMEGLSNDQIAQALQISKRTVETHISNALKFLKEKLLIVSVLIGF